MSWTNHARNHHLAAQFEQARNAKEAQAREYPMCSCGKRCLSRKEAYGAVRYAKEHNHLRHQKHIPKRVYFCKMCGTYHTTSTPIKEYREGRSDES